MPRTQIAQLVAAISEFSSPAPRRRPGSRPRLNDPCVGATGLDSDDPGLDFDTWAIGRFSHREQRDDAADGKQDDDGERD